VSEANHMLGVGTPTFTVAGSALRWEENLYNCHELDDLLLRANAISFKQETGTMQVTTMCTVPIKRPSRLFGFTYNCTTVYEFSFQKKIRVCQDKYWCSYLLNLNVQFQKIFTPNTHLWPVYRNSKLRYQEERALTEKNLHVGYESFLEENNVREIINYKIMFKKYLTW